MADEDHTPLQAPEPPPAADRWDGQLDAPRFHIDTDDTAVLRRVKSLAATRPLHDLSRNKNSWDGDFWDRYDLASLALATIDQVALHMGISAGLRVDDTIAYCANEAARQQPSDAHTVWDTVADKVVNALIGTDAHQMPYTTIIDGTPVERVYTYRLLYEQWNSDDNVYLRASEEAINVLVNGLDVDVESAQIAAEAQMRALIERNAYDLAGMISVQARYQTIKYLERVRTVVADTLVDPDSHDWADSIPNELNRALAHVEDRITAERALIVSIEDGRDVIADVDMRRKANELIANVRDCLSRHTELQRHLMTARSNLRRAQDERFGRRRGTIRRSDLEHDLLVPLLAATTRHAVEPGIGVVFTLGSLHQSLLPTFAVLVDDCATQPTAAQPGDIVDEPEFSNDDLEPWWEPYWDAADEHIAGLDAATSLSQLLNRITDSDLDDATDRHLLLAAVCHLAYEHTAQRLAGDDDGQRIVLAVPTGRQLTVGPIRGDDILLVPATLADTAVTHPAGAGVPSDSSAAHADTGAH